MEKKWHSVGESDTFQAALRAGRRQKKMKTPFKTKVKTLAGCIHCRQHAVCMYCLGLVHRPKEKRA